MCNFFVSYFYSKNTLFNSANEFIYNFKFEVQRY